MTDDEFKTWEVPDVELGDDDGLIFDIRDVAMAERDRYTPFVHFEVPGGWLALVACRDCGAALMPLPSEESALDVHDRWHEAFTSV